MSKSYFTLRLEGLFLIAFVAIGTLAALDVGIGWDEIYELNTYLINRDAFLGLLNGDATNYNTLINHQDRYYGIGFHTLTHAFAYLTSLVGLHPDLLTNVGKQLTIKHIPIFLSFLISGYLIKRILLSITNNQTIAVLGMISYLLWPYLLGHGLMNIKDMPFLLVWLLCTFRVLALFDQNLISANPMGFRKKIFILALCSGCLVTIRISGVLIFIEYGIFGALALQHLGYKQISRILSMQGIFLSTLIFFVPFFAIIFLLYPIFWHNPFEFLNAIFYQSHNPIRMDTLTAGNIISNRDFLLKYVLIWFGVKLPFINLLGLALTPLLLYKLLDTKNQQLRIDLLKVLGLSLTTATIIFFLVINKVHLYNELRHVLFIFPLLFIVAISNLYLASKKLCTFLLAGTSIIFAIDNVKLHPYQYTYLNEIVRFLPISEEFEKDYFALSAGRSAKWLNANPTEVVGCIYASPLHVWMFQIDQTQFLCNKDYPGHDLHQEKAPFLLYGQVRKQDGFTPLPTCRLLHTEFRQLFLSNYKLQMSNLFACDPAD